LKILLEQSDKTVWEKDCDISKRHFLFRKAARAVILDSDGKVGLMYLKKRGIYKLPGGGVEPGESVLEALVREVKEEVGVYVKINRELGITIESRNYEKDETGLLQITYAFLVGIIKDKEFPTFTQDELNEGAEAVWLEKRDAISTVLDYPVSDYESKFIKLRELAILKEASKYWDNL
jgi:8-oxo-dGTP diphosphatase